MNSSEIAKIADYLSAILVHAMAHWKIVALYVLHEQHQSITFSFALIAFTAFAEHLFIYTATPQKFHKVLFTIHHLTIVAFCLNILLRGHKPWWIVIIIIWSLLHALPYTHKAITLSVITAADIIAITSGFYYLFTC